MKLMFKGSKVFCQRRSIPLIFPRVTLQQIYRFFSNIEFHLIFYVIQFFIINEDATKKFGKFFRKLLRWSLFQLSYKSTVYRLQIYYKETSLQFLFLEYVTKTSCLKKNILRKKSVVQQRFHKVAALQCSPAMSSGQNLKKP